MRILIPDVQNRNVLSVLRSLGPKGYEFTLAIPLPEKKNSKTFRLSISRYVSNLYFVQSPNNNEDEFVRDVVNIARKQRHDILFTFTDGTTLALARHREELKELVRPGFSELSSVETAHDKTRMNRLAMSVNVPTPKTFYPETENQISKLNGINFPVVIKAREGSGVEHGVRYALDKDELLRHYKELQDSKPALNYFDTRAPFIQEYIPGEHHDYVCVCNNGEVIADLTQKRLVTYPVSGGVMASSITTDYPVLKDYGRRLMKALSIHGVAEADFKYDPRKKDFVFLEVNPRPLGGLGLSVKAGINFIEIAAKMIMGEPLPTDFSYRKGVKYRWIFPEELFTVISANSLKMWCRFFNFFEPDVYYDISLKDWKSDLYRVSAVFKQIILRQARITNPFPHYKHIEELALKLRQNV